MYVCVYIYMHIHCPVELEVLKPCAKMCGVEGAVAFLCRPWNSKYLLQEDTMPVKGRFLNV